MKRFYIFSAAVLCLVASTNAQVDPNAYGYYQSTNEFSKTDLSGSARTRGMAGAQNAVGGDPGSINTNPAGLGIIRSSQFSITGNIQLANTTSDYSTPVGDASSTVDFKPGFNLPNVALIFSDTYDNPESRSTLKNQSFGISVNRMYNYSNKYSYSGTNNTYTNLRSSLVEQANGRSFEDVANDPGLLGYAWETYALVEVTALDGDSNEVYTNEYFTPDGVDGTTVTQTENINISGAMNETSFSYGGNYDDKVFFGFSVGIPRIRYERERTYLEKTDAQYDLDYFEIQENEELSGTGVNATLGLIIRPSDYFRIGASLKTPSIIWMTESFERTVNTRFNYDFLDEGDYFPNYGSVTIPLNGTEFSYTGDKSRFDYTMLTPMRANLGTSFFFGKSGFIAADLEYVPYSTARISSSGYTLSGDNNTISSLYGNALNVRLGGEYRYKVLRARAGYAHYGSTYASNDLDNSRNYITVGFGIKKESHFLDFAIVNSVTKDSYEPYSLENGQQPKVDLKSNLAQVLVTYGLSF